MIGSALRQTTMRWIADDPSPADRAELQQILADAIGGSESALAQVQDRMQAPLAFGTAGLRGPLRAGPAGMNLATVRRAAAGIGAHLTKNGGTAQTVVIGFDGRHRSAEFAKDAAGVFAAAGFSTLLAPSALPTPVTAYAVRKLGAAAGIQITASHNPPQDNGIKVYLQAGAQIVAPVDGQIEVEIAAIGPAVSVDAGGTPSGWPATLLDDYLAAAGSLARGGSKDLRVAATAMHGVGGESLVKALTLAGFTDVHVVTAQATPDPDFSTVPFPNPEEPGATDLLLALAAAVDADIAIANDPDADRCALGVKLPDGSWRMLRGDETGSLLGDHVLAGVDRTLHPDPLAATTIVSSALLRSIAAARGARYDETLTGFKWIVRAGDGAGTGLVFGYEEALGVCVDPDVVRDKDGISAAVVACDLAAGLKAHGLTLLDDLDRLAREHGLHVTDQLSVRVTDLTVISDAMARLRANLPDALLGAPVVEAKDLLPATDAIILRTDSARVVVRPSGTEPKLKCYLEVVTPVAADAENLQGPREIAAAQLVSLKTEVAGILGL